MVATKTLHMIGNAHLDPVWLWTWQEGYQEAKATFRSALDRLREYPEFVFTSSSAAIYAWIAHAEPEMLDEIRERVREGRWRIEGGWWIQPDCNLPLGESLVRQGLYGQRTFRELLGVTATVGYNVDSFGHAGTLPQILYGCGLTRYVFMRPKPHEKALPAPLFRWEGSDGSGVLAYRLPNGYCTSPEELGAHIRAAAAALPPGGVGICFFGVGNHGGGPTRANIESILALREESPELRLVLSSPERFFAEVSGEAGAGSEGAATRGDDAPEVGPSPAREAAAERGHTATAGEDAGSRVLASAGPTSDAEAGAACSEGVDADPRGGRYEPGGGHTGPGGAEAGPSRRAAVAAIPVVRDELQHHAPGCYAAHSGVKRWNRRTEHLLLAAEKASAVAARVAGLPYPAAELRHAWQQVLFNQFHDILAGTSIEPAYEDARDAYGEASAIASRALNAALQRISWRVRIDREPGVRPIFVWNPHPWPVRAPVELEMGRVQAGDVLLDPDGARAPWQAVRSLATVGGWRSRLLAVAELPPLGYRVYRLLPGPAAEDQHPDAAREAPPPSQADAAAAGDGPVVAEEPDAPRNLATPTSDADLDPATPDSGARGAVAGTATGGVIEIATERFCLAVDTAAGCIASLRDERSGHEVFAAPAARAVVLDDPSDTWSHSVTRYDRERGAFGDATVRLVEDGPVRRLIRAVSTYGESRLVQEYALYPGLPYVEVRVTVDWRERFAALKLRFPLALWSTSATYEAPYGQVARSSTGDEEPGQAWVDLSGMDAATGEPAGLALLADAKQSVSTREGMIELTALRSPIYAHHDPAVPEPEEEYAFIDQGVQRFTYRLVPHAGSWRDADLARRGWELGQPPVALPESPHDGPLPQSASYARVDAPNVVVSVLKEAEDGGDLVLRLYETHGLPAEAVVHLDAWDRRIEARLRPGEIRTYRVPADPARPPYGTTMLEDPSAPSA